MKIAFASTYPPRECGIATYTEKLARHVVEIGDVDDLRIIAEDGGASSHSKIGADPCFSRKDTYVDNVLAAANRRNVDVVHFQHSPDIWGLGAEFLQTMERLRRAGRKSVVTLHSVYTVGSGLIERKFFVRGFHRKLGHAVDKIVVHSEGSRDILLKHGVPLRKIGLIPHGTDPYEVGDAQVGREVIGCDPDDKVLLFFGFIHMQKNIHVLLRAMPRILKEVPNAKLIIAGKVAGNTWYNRLYLGHLRRLARRLKIQDNIIIIDRFIEEENVPHLYAAADLVLLPHAQGYGSASGVVHLAMTMKRPLICSDSIKFEEVGSNIDENLLVPTHKPKAWALQIAKMLADGAYLNSVEKSMNRYAEDTFWPQTAQKHVDIYKTIVPRDDDEV